MKENRSLGINRTTAYRILTLGTLFVGGAFAPKDCGGGNENGVNTYEDAVIQAKNADRPTPMPLPSPIPSLDAGQALQNLNGAALTLQAPQTP